MSIQFADAFNQLIREKRIDRELLLETLSAGFASAASDAPAVRAITR